MSCFVVPMIQAVATTICRKRCPKDATSMWKRELPTLEKMLWGGTLVLIVDHIANGEFVWAGLQAALHEMLTVGVPMSLVVTAVWAVVVLVKARSLSCQAR